MEISRTVNLHGEIAPLVIESMLCLIGLDFVASGIIALRAKNEESLKGLLLDLFCIRWFRPLRTKNPPRYRLTLLFFGRQTMGLYIFLTGITLISDNVAKILPGQ